MITRIANSDMNIQEYAENVENYLEYLGYPELVMAFNAADVARSMAAAEITFYLHGLSYRMCAITILACTMRYQIIPAAKRSVIH